MCFAVTGDSTAVKPQQSGGPSRVAVKRQMGLELQHGVACSCLSHFAHVLAVPLEVFLRSFIAAPAVVLVQMWGTVLPLDVAKTRIQTAQPGSAWDTGVLKQLRMLWAEGGRRALWTGLAPTLVRAFPANACQWLAWEVAMRQLLPAAYEEGGSSSTGGGGDAGSDRVGQGQLLGAGAAVAG